MSPGRRAPGPAAASLVEALPLPLLALDGEDRVTFANLAAEQWFGAGRARLEGRAIAEIAPPGSPLAEVARRVRGGEGREGGSLTEYDVDLSGPRMPRTADIYAAPLGGPGEGVLLLLQPRAMAEKMKSQLVHRDAARSAGAMAAMLAHEIKNPLSGIRGAAQLLEDALAPSRRPLSTLIRDEVDRIVRLVERFEIFSDERPLPMAPVNLHEVLEHVARLAQSGFAASIAFEKHFDPSLPAIEGNRDRLVQAILNLVKNAAEAIGPEAAGGRITLTTAFRPGVSVVLPASGGRLALPFEICVIDNGPGVPAHLAGHLFEPFVTSKTSGTGLGLALVAKVVRDHGGIVECEGGEGRTLFRILLPRAREGARD